MQILVLRHASAFDVGTSGIVRDEDRVLSQAGEKETEGVGRALSRLDSLPGKAFSSPLDRCVQTVQKVLAFADRSAPIEVSPALKPGATPMAIAGLLTSRAGGIDRVLIVAHEPDLSRFIGSLIGQERWSVAFVPGSLARVDVENPKTGWTGRLRWFFPPDALSTLLAT